MVQIENPGGVFIAPPPGLYVLAYLSEFKVLNSMSSKESSINYIQECDLHMYSNIHLIYMFQMFLLEHRFYIYQEVVKSELGVDEISLSF